MKRILVKPKRDITLFAVKAYDGEACINGDDNKVTVNGADCKSTTFDFGGLFDLIGKFIGKGK